MSKSKITAGNLANAICVLNKLERRIDSQAKSSVSWNGSWFSQERRNELMVRDSVERMQAIRTVIRDLTLWQGDMERTARRGAKTQNHETTSI